MWLFPLYLKNEAEQKVGHGKSFPATCDFRRLGHYPRRLLLEDTGWRGTHPEKGKVLPPGGSDQSTDGHSRRQGRCVCAHKSSCFCLGGGVGGEEEEACLGSPVFVVCSRVPKVSTWLFCPLQQLWVCLGVGYTPS